MTQPIKLAGRLHTGVNLTVNGPVPVGAPRMYVAEVGISHLDAGERDLWKPDALGTIKDVASAMRNAPHGLFIAFLETHDGPHPLVLVQDDRSVFSEQHHGSITPGKPAWRDFYFAAGHVAIDLADQFWEPQVVGVRNLSGGPALPPDALVALLEGVCSLLDNRELRLRQLDFSGHDGLDAALARGVAILEEEQEQNSPPAFRPLLTETCDPGELGLRDPRVELRLVRVDVPRSRRPAMKGS